MAQPYGVIVKTTINTAVVDGEKIRNEVQSALDQALSANPIVLRNFTAQIDKSTSSIEIEITKIDASEAVAKLRSELTDMLSGLSITGLKDFLGTEGVEATYSKAAKAAEDLANAQGNVQKKARSANVELRKLTQLSSVLNSVYKKTFSVTDDNTRVDFQAEITRIMKDINDAKKASDDVRVGLVASVEASVQSITQQVTAHLEAADAAKKHAEEVRKAGGEEAYAAQQAEKLRKAQESVQKGSSEMRAELQKLSSLESTMKNLFGRTSSLTDENIRAGDQSEIAALMKRINDARTLTGDALKQEVATISDLVAKIKEEAEAHLASAAEAKKKAAAVKAAGSEEAYAAQLATNEAKRQESVNKKLSTLQKQLQAALKSNSAVYEEHRSEIEGWLKTLEGSKSAASDVAIIGATFSEIKVQADRATSSSTNFIGKISTGFDKLKSIYTQIRGMTTVIETFKKMYNAVKDLDAAMTELRKVTDLTSQGYANLMQESTVMAKSVGASVADTVNATADFARLGFDVDGAQALAEAALVYKNVGDGITDISTATESLISTIKAFEDFGYAAEDSMFIIDKFNEVGRFCPAA